jgi:hypothetical protein
MVHTITTIFGVQSWKILYIRWLILIFLFSHLQNCTHNYNNIYFICFIRFVIPKFLKFREKILKFRKLENTQNSFSLKCIKRGGGEEEEKRREGRERDKKEIKRREKGEKKERKRREKGEEKERKRREKGEKKEWKRREKGGRKERKRSEKGEKKEGERSEGEKEDTITPHLLAWKSMMGSIAWTRR